MGKNPKSVLKIKGISIYQFQLSKEDSEGYRGINIRISNRVKTGEKKVKGVTKYLYNHKSVDLEVYDEKGQRIKSKPKHFVNGNLIGGYDKDIVDKYNRRINTLKDKCSQYVSTNPHFNKQLLLDYLYPTDFISTHKKKKTKYITIPVHHKERVIDSIEIEQKALDKILDTHTSEQTFINSDGKKKTTYGQFDIDTGENLIESIEDVQDLIVQAKGYNDYSKYSLEEQQKIQRMSAAERYSLGHYDKNNILHLFGSVYYDTLENQQNERVVLRIFDYVENTGASTNVANFNIDWANQFFNWIKEHGRIATSSKNFDPLKYDREIFLNKSRTKYKKGALKKQIVSFNVVAKHLYKKDLLPSLDHSKFVKVSIEEGQRNTHHLLLEEYDTIFNLSFSNTKLKSYQALFENLKNDGIIKGTFKTDISIENLKAYRDLFCFQIMIGGLRGLPEYNSVELIDYDKEGKVFRFLQEKVQKGKEKKKHLLNPLNKYTVELLKRNKGVLPTIDSEAKLNGYLKLIAHIAGLNRQFEKGKSIKENLSQYFARKTFGNILFAEGLGEDQISLFTGHETRKSELGTSYLDLQNVNLKRKIYKQVKFL